MSNLFFYRLLTSFLGSFSGKFDLLILCGDIESNPRPNSGESFSICHWNLNSITAHNFSKISLLRVYNAILNYDICLSETYLNHNTLSGSDNLKIQGYELIRVDHPSTQKRGGICIYHKDFLLIKVNNISCLKECLNFSLSVYGKQCNITLIYHLPSQSEESGKFSSTVSPLPICSKIFERIIYDNMLKYFLDNNLITPKQSGFRPGDACINQLLSITHDVVTSFDNGLEVRGVFLDISKAFDKAWHDGLIYKLKQNGIKYKLPAIASKE